MDDATNNATFVINRNYQDLTKKTIQYLGLVYFTFGIIISYLWVCIDLDVKYQSNPSFHTYWIPAVAIYSVINLILFIVVYVNLYWKWKTSATSAYRFIKNDKKLVYLIIIPLFIISFIFLTIVIVETSILIKCETFLNILLTLGSLLLTIATIILICDVSNDIETDQQSSFRRILLFFIVIALANCLMFNITLQNLLIFKSESKNDIYYGNKFVSNFSCYNISDRFIGDIHRLHTTLINLRPFLILFCICSIAYLIQPLISKEYTQESINRNLNQFQIINEIEENRTFRLPRLSLLTCVFFLSLSILAVILIYSISDSQVGAALVYYWLTIVVYICGIMFTIFYCKEVLQWPVNDRHDKIFDNCILWIGAMGQMFVSVSDFTKSVNGITTGYCPYLICIDKDYFYLFHLNVSGVIVAIVLFFQTYFQTILISLSLDRRWSRPNRESWIESFCPAVGMMGLNIGLLLISTVDLKRNVLGDKNKYLSMELFTNGLHSIGENLGFLQRLYCSLYFATMIIYTYN